MASRDSKVLRSAARKPPNAGKGRKKGVPNKVTADVKGAISELAQGNIAKVQGWLDRVAKDDPDKAIDLFLKMLEYNIPKLARSEHTGEDGGPVVVSLSGADMKIATG